ncbi:hypothetical protein M422DRAFT_269147 [Sphaerobolus stellatus SS14]|uniref:Uncharacterized protein n=1 Tax=Sphaerobolus stellatus (strain SS14) TaxID=990650 RepID=A0A0C9TIT4_SPHS4|nr:hypothetical protein M422DRAFT_269147 [Sphaerobolus stellatus SS14]
MLSGFKVVAGFNTRRDPSRNEEWDGYSVTERTVLVNRYWEVYDKEFKELEELYLALVRKEATEKESQRKSDEKKKKKSKTTTQVALGFGASKGKEKEVEVIDDSDSNADAEFQEICVGCRCAKVKCIFTHAPNSKKVACDRFVDRKTNCTYRSPQDLIMQRELRSLRKSITNIEVKSEVRNCLQAKSFYHQYNLQVISGLQWSLSALSNIDGQDIGLRTLDNQLPSDLLVPEELQDVVEHCRAHVIEWYNNIAQMCGNQMKSISSWYNLGSGFGAQVPLLNRYGKLDLLGEADSRVKRGREEENGAESGPSKRIRIEKKPETVEEGVEEEVGPDPVLVETDKGKGKEKEVGPEGNGEETMKE